MPLYIQEKQAVAGAFICDECGHIMNADTNAGVNIGAQVLADVPLGLLHTFDRYGRAEPKRLKQQTIKHIVSNQLYRESPPGALTDLLTPGSTTKPGGTVASCRL